MNRKKYFNIDKIKILLGIMLLLLNVTTIVGQGEAFYSDLIAQALDGKREVGVESGRVDVLTVDYAIEVKKASSWKHTIGQALWYAQQSNRQPGIVLVMKSIKDRKYGVMLQSTLNYAGLENTVKVWFWPEDFGMSFEDAQALSTMYKNNLLSDIDCQYWITTSSHKRHNRNCSVFGNSNGRCATSGEGVACKRCGG